MSFGAGYPSVSHTRPADAGGVHAGLDRHTTRTLIAIVSAG